MRLEREVEARPQRFAAVLKICVDPESLSDIIIVGLITEPCKVPAHQPSHSSLGEKTGVHLGLCCRVLLERRGLSGSAPPKESTVTVGGGWGASPGN